MLVPLDDTPGTPGGVGRFRTGPLEIAAVKARGKNQITIYNRVTILANETKTRRPEKSLSMHHITNRTHWSNGIANRLVF